MIGQLRLGSGGWLGRLLAAALAVLALLWTLRTFAAPIFLGCAAVAGWRLWRYEKADFSSQPARAAPTPSAGFPPAPTRPQVRPLEDVLAELDTLVGLRSVKAEVSRLIDVLRADQERRRHGLAYSTRLVRPSPQHRCPPTAGPCAASGSERGRRRAHGS